MNAMENPSNSVIKTTFMTTVDIALSCIFDEIKNIVSHYCFLMSMKNTEDAYQRLRQKLIRCFLSNYKEQLVFTRYIKNAFWRFWIFI